MQKLILYYSYTGHAKTLAESLAGREDAVLAAIEAVKRPGLLAAYTKGAFAAMRGTPWPIRPLSVRWQDHDQIMLISPIWAGQPAPFIYAALAQLPAGKRVAVKLVSGSGRSNCRERLQAMVEQQGCTLESIEDHKS